MVAIAAAARAGLDMNIDVAGPDPDETNMPNVQEALESQGYTISWTPADFSASVTAIDDRAEQLATELRSCET